MRYPIAIHKEPGSCYGVSVPDMPGCITGGDTIDEAIAMAREAALLHLEGVLDDGQAIPTPTPIEALRRKAEFAGAVWAYVDVDVAEVSRAQRINITMPTRILEAADRYAQSHGESRSGLLTKAVVCYMQPTPGNRSTDAKVPRPGKKASGSATRPAARSKLR